MKVCVISIKECWRGPDGVWLTDGGFPRQMAAIASMFDEIELLVVETVPRAGGMPLPPEAKVVPLTKPVGIDLRRKLSLAAGLPWYLRTMVRQARCADVVHTPLPGDFALLGLLVGLALRKRVLARYCGSWHRTSITTLFNSVTRACMRVFADGRNIMLATGEDETPPAPNIYWLHASALSRAELESFQPRLERGLSNPPAIVFLGRLSPEKGVASLVRAIGALAAEGFDPMPQVTLVGDGPQREELEQLCDSLRCRSYIRFVGQLERTQMSKLVGEADFCVQPSLSESFCKAWIDAMAHGLPVLTCSVGAAAAVVGSPGERGWMVPPGDVGALTTTLKAVLRDPLDWPSLRRRCRAYAETRTADDWRDRIAQICSERWRCSLADGKLVA